jgi:hypothetical protein
MVTEFEQSTEQATRPQLLNDFLYFLQWPQDILNQVRAVPTTFGAARCLVWKSQDNESSIGLRECSARKCFSGALEVLLQTDGMVLPFRPSNAVFITT